MTALTSSWTDDDGSGTVGTIINNAQLQAIYQNTGRADNHTVGGRLTLTSGSPVTTSDVTGATTIYYTPYLGDVISLYDGSANWIPVSFAETSLSLGTLTNGLPYDVFGFNNSGTLGLELLAWSNGTTRATALVYQNGVLVKTGATTRRYLGTFHTTATTTTEDSVLKRLLWNYYNRVRRSLYFFETTASWNYTTATVRQMNGNTANQVDVVVGVAEAFIDLMHTAQFQNTNTNVQVMAGIAEDTTSAFSSANSIGGISASLTAAVASQSVFSRFAKYPAIGHHFYAGIEYSQAVGTTTWFSSGVLANYAGAKGWIDG